MQKKIIALAIAGLASTAAFAQTNVTVYGIMDAGFNTASGKVAQGVAGQPATKSGRVTGVDSGLLSGSRLGFRGTEDLGNGLKALFVYEMGLTIDNGVHTGAARQSFVGLTGNFGTVVAGRLQTPGYDWAAKFDSQAASSFSGVHFLRSQNTTLHAAARVNNAAAYVSPNFGGVVAKVAYSFGEQDGVVTPAAVANSKEDKTGILALSADYDNGPLSVGVVHHRLNNLTSAPAAPVQNQDDQREWGVAASYDFGFVRPIVSYQNLKHSYGSSANTNGNYSEKTWAVGAIAPIGKGNLHVQYARNKGDNNALNNGAALAAGLTNKATAWSIGYTHGLSKRTTLYTGYTRAKLDDGSQVAGTGFGGLTTIANEKYSRFTAGIRHSF